MTTESLEGVSSAGAGPCDEDTNASGYKGLVNSAYAILQPLDGEFPIVRTGISGWLRPSG